jgi:hypothetical protein
MYNKMAGMKKTDLQAMYKGMGEGVEVDEELSLEEDLTLDTNSQLAELVENEATLSEEFKEKTAILFEAAVSAKVSEAVSNLEEQYAQELAEEIASTKNDLVEKIDGYLNYVVENWMEENKLAIQNGLRTEIAEEFMGNLKNLFVESYIEVPDSKVDLVDGLAEQVEELESKLNESTAQAIAMNEELEVLKREAIIRESSRDMAETQVDKLRNLAEKIDFDDEETFAKKVNAIKESFFSAKEETHSIIEETENDDETVEVSPMMEQYLKTLNRFK